MIGSFFQISFAIDSLQVFNQMWPWDSQRSIMYYLFFVGPCAGGSSLDVTDSNCLQCMMMMMMMPQLLWLQINMWILKLSGFPCRHMFLSLFLSLFSNTLLISLHSLTAWTLCCAYCSVTHLPSFFSKRGVLPKSTFFRLWRCRSWLFLLKL